jgi:hypothetical protein
MLRVDHSEQFIWSRHHDDARCANEPHGPEVVGGVITGIVAAVKPPLKRDFKYSYGT